MRSHDSYMYIYTYIVYVMICLYVNINEFKVLLFLDRCELEVNEFSHLEWCVCANDEHSKDIFYSHCCSVRWFVEITKLDRNVAAVKNGELIRYSLVKSNLCTVCKDNWAHTSNLMIKNASEDKNRNPHHAHIHKHIQEKIN